MSDLPPQLQPDIAVQDAVHGRIWLTRLERHVVNTAEFQRLRSIGQLGLGRYVFPSADHSRFVHSLGATHVMGWMLRQKPLQDYFAERVGMIQCLRLAALLHDIGHYPFSHLGENAWGAAALGAIELYAGSAADRSIYDAAAEVAHEPATSHEALSTKIILGSCIHEIIDDAIPEIDGRQPSEVVASIIDGSYPDLVCQNLVSSDLDCDRLDYLVRDSVVAGLTYGLVDLAYLVENLQVAEHEEHGPMLAIDKAHGSQAVEHFILARYYHYAQFITHKTIVSAELILAAAILEMIRLEKLPNASEVTQMVGSERYHSFTDAAVWVGLGQALTENWASPDLREAATRLFHRDLLKIAYDIEQLEEEETSLAGDRLDHLFDRPSRKVDSANRAGVDPDRICYKRGVLALVGIAGKVAPTAAVEETERLRLRWVKSVKVSEPAGVPELLVEQTGLLRELSLRRWVTRRLFVREESRRAEKSNRPTCDRLNEFVRQELTTT